ncbi:MAG: hypothetical protein ACKO96_33755, partial [Flammeovirgaceae bacterium]
MFWSEGDAIFFPGCIFLTSIIAPRKLFCGKLIILKTAYPIIALIKMLNRNEKCYITEALATFFYPNNIKIISHASSLAQLT